MMTATPQASRLAIALTTAAILASALPAHAVDGVLEINQTCAVNTGCFAGDTAGWPVAITVSGSYRLTGNLTVPDGNTTAILLPGGIRATIDLNGFEITCSGACGAGTGDGIDAGALGQRLTVTNGSIQFMGDKGINGALVTVVERVQLENNFGGGVLAGSDSRITNSQIVGNQGRGIQCGEGCTVSHNSLDSNGGDGIHAGINSSITENTVRSSSGHGIFTSGQSEVHGNTSATNQGSGIFCLSGCRITGNTTTQNSASGIVGDQSVITENTSSANVFGIESSLATVLGNTVFSNGGFGLFGSATGYANNQFHQNNGGNAFPQVSGGLLEIGTNVCGGNTTCP